MTATFSKLLLFNKNKPPHFWGCKTIVGFELLKQKLLVKNLMFLFLLLCDQLQKYIWFKVLPTPSTYCEANIIAAGGMFSYFSAVVPLVKQTAIGSWHFVSTQEHLKEAKILIKWCESMTNTILKIFNQNNCSNQKCHKHLIFFYCAVLKGWKYIGVCQLFLFKTNHCAFFSLLPWCFHSGIYSLQGFSHPSLWPSDTSNLNFRDWHSAPTKSTAGATESSVMTHFVLDFCSQWEISFIWNWAFLVLLQIESTLQKNRPTPCDL